MDAQNQSSLNSVEEDAVDLGQYLRTVMRHKWSIFTFALIMAALSALVVYSLEPVYKATATLLIENKKTKVVSIEEVYGFEPSSKQYYRTQFEILKSRKLAEKVINDMGLIEHPEFNHQPAFRFNWRVYAGQFIPDLMPSEPSLKARYQQLVVQFISRLSIDYIRNTHLVNITFEAYDPDFAAEIANAIGEAYIEAGLEAKLEQTVKASSWLNERMGGLKERLKAAEGRLQSFREREQIVGENGGLDIAGNELGLVADKLAEARRQRLELENLHREIQSIGKGQVEKFERLPPVFSHPVVQSYKETLLKAEQKKSELSKRYGSKHPKMIAINSELSTARRSLNRQIMSVVNGIENQYRMARSSERSLEGSLGNTKAQIQGLKRKEYQLRELEQEVETNRQLYDTFFTRLNETAATGGLETAAARITDPAVSPLSPAKPKKKLIILLSFAASLFLGVACAVLLEIMNNTIRSSSDVQSKLGQSMLGLLPKLAGRKNEKASYRHYVEDNKSSFSESVRTIRTGLVLSSLDNPHKTIAVTSTVPGEGKTSTALSLAYSLGQMGRVLLIDADMRRPSIGKLFKFGSAAPGLSNLVAGTAALEDCVHTLDKEGIDVMSAGVIPPNPLELLSSKRFSKVLEVLEKRYDRIIIDSPPCQAVSDALVLAPQVASMVYVVKADSTKKAQIKIGLKRLANVNAPVVGVVLNQVDLKKSARYYGEDYSGYYDVYGYGANEKTA